MFYDRFAINFEHDEFKDEDDNGDEETRDQNDVGEDEESQAHDFYFADFPSWGCIHGWH